MSYSDRLRALSPGAFDCPDLEETGQIRLPESVLHAVMQGDAMPSVMLFQIRNPRLSTVISAGVRDFAIPPGQCCIPYWMMEYLQIGEGDTVVVSLTDLPTATRALFQPQDSKFLDLPNPKVVLEFTLRRYPCLTQGTMLKINFNKKVYNLKVLKTEPAKAVATLHADVICDFATPVNEFDHNWCKSDTDSSDEDMVKPMVGRTLAGGTVVTTPKPLRSTFAQREQERRTKPNVAGVTRIEAGREILPPKPKEAIRKKKAVQKFVGEAKTLKNRGGQQQAATTKEAPAQKAEPKPERPATANAEKKPAVSAFTGQARTLKGAEPSGQPAASRPATAKPAPAAAEKPPEEKKNPFMGKPRSLK